MKEEETKKRRRVDEREKRRALGWLEPVGTSQDIADTLLKGTVGFRR
jgi:hypothetical protein